MASTSNLSNEISLAMGEGKRGCTLCALWSREEEAMVDMIRTDGAPTNSELREKIVAATGFCNRHTYVIQRGIQSPKGDESFGGSASAQLVLKKIEDSLTALLAEVKGASGKEQIADVISKLERTLYGQAVCPVCEKLLKSDKERISSLLHMLDSKDFADKYEKSDAICVPHFVSVMKLLPSSGLKSTEAVWGLLMKTELARLGAVDTVLNERMNKYSWDHRSEGVTQEEAGAQNAGKLLITGVEGLYCRPRKTSLRPSRES
ncbi:MAG TPA: DUF6062 family protein [Nitrososphaerales archaeon]|nr:DUF6062 family protein [Nitrososphaerales archaeon]